VQVHGGVHVASDKWLQALEQLSREFGFLLIVDETMTSGGRLGPYFSFERAGIHPDMVLVSNAIAGGLPMSMLLLRPELDQWRPGEQAGGFQGDRSEEHTSELQSLTNLVCRLLLEKKKREQQDR